MKRLSGSLGRGDNLGTSKIVVVNVSVETYNNNNYITLFYG